MFVSAALLSISMVFTPAVSHNPNFTYEKTTVKSSYVTKKFSTTSVKDLIVQGATDIVGTGTCLTTHLDLYRQTIKNGHDFYIHVGATKNLNCGTGKAKWANLSVHKNYYFVVSVTPFSSNSVHYHYLGDVYYNGNTPSS